MKRASDFELIQLAETSKDLKTLLEVSGYSSVAELVDKLKSILSKYGYKTIPKLPLQLPDEVKSMIYEDLLTKETAGREVAGIDIREQILGGYAEENFSEFIPEGDFFEREGYKEIEVALNSGFSTYLVGVAGTGKTTFASWYAKKYNKPLLVINCDMGGLRDLLGVWTIVTEEKAKGEQGELLKFNFGLLAKFIVIPSVILFDEVNSLEPEELFFLHELLNNRRVFIKDAPNFPPINANPETKFILASNPSSYLGTKPLNIALLSRVVVFEVKPFTKEEIKQIIPEADEDILSCYAKVNNYLIEHQVETVFSIREIQQYIKLYKEYKEKVELTEEEKKVGIETNEVKAKSLAIETAFLNKAKQSCEEDEYNELRAIVSEQLGVVL